MKQPATTLRPPRHSVAYATGTPAITTSVAPVEARRRDWLGLAVLALPCLLVSMDLTVLNLALPALSADLAPTSSQLLWIVDIYGFLVAGSLIAMGTLGDRIGRRRLLLLGACAFGGASVLAAYASSATMLIAARALLGIAGATLAPSTLSLIRSMFHDPRQRSVAVGVWVTSFSVGGVLGPLVGGVLLAHFWWGSVFLIAVPVMLLLLALGPVVLPEACNPQAGRVDLPSVALSLAAVLAVIAGLKRVAEQGVAWLPLLSIGCGLLAGWAFVRRQRRLADPLIDLRMVRTGMVHAALVVNILSLAVAYGGALAIAQYLQVVRGLSPGAAGLWMIPAPGAFIAGSLLAPLLARRVRAAWVMAGGLALAAGGFGALASLAVDSPLIVLASASILYSLGIAPVVTLATELVVGSAPIEHAGAAAALGETSAELGGALGIAILGSLGTAVYRAHMAAVVDTIVPPEVAAAAWDTLGGAIVVAAQLPDSRGAALLDASRAAFIAGLHSIASVSAVLMAALALGTIVRLRQVHERSEPTVQPDIA